MKKRIKFLFTIASLCFAVAVLCFGVYSATTVTYTASGTVSYEVDSVFCKIETSVHYAKDLKKSLGSVEAVTTEAGKVAAANWTATGTAIAAYDTKSDPNAAAPTAVTLDPFNFGTSSLYRITVVVTLYKQANTIKLTHNLVSKDAPNALVNTTIATAANVDNIDASTGEKTQTLTFYVALADVTTAASGGFTLTVNVAQAGA